ncbi:hypothetical protein [Microbacterium sp.]|uniref:hypothetical protein n=1 Tax=Microbacterium sp. TaxID=51671 RepID=UPI0009291C3A|nr:hypothetical protein [Microbacterium sp.]MBN9193788.1 hypothetical protein [Microbacterium sp.]OJU66291.1 MAG: hypothetical protein BGO04_13850 [Microbacterium sp. 70-38]
MEYQEALERARTAGELVWHYATLDTLGIILQTNCLLATEVSFQNDIRETSTADIAFSAALQAMTEGAKYGAFAREAIKYLQDEELWQPNFSPVSGPLTRNARFILCASEDPDSLYAWRTYSQGGISCAIGLDPKTALGVVDPGPNPSQRRVHHWRPVIYAPAEIQLEAERVLAQLGDRWLLERGEGLSASDANAALLVIITDLAETRSRVRAVAKDQSFEDEHEQRVTVDRVSFNALMTTPSNMGPRPQVRLVSSTHAQWSEPFEKADLAPKLPIRAIRLGPDAPDSATTATQWLLLANGYEIDPTPDGHNGSSVSTNWADAVILDRSRHPYRTR